jgi:WD40 repeat protein
VFISGESAGSTNPDYATVAYDSSSGAKLWARRYDGPKNGDDSARALGVSPDGSKLFVSGQSDGGSTGFDYAIIGYDASSGTKLWASRYNGPANGHDLATALGVSPDGSKVFVTGESTGSASYYDYATVAYDASSGTRLWAKRYDGPGSGFDLDSASALGVSPDGSKVFVSGGSDGSTSFDCTTFAYDASSGAKLWGKRYSAPESRFCQTNALGASPDGSKVFVTGVSTGPKDGGFGPFDYATVGYDASSGEELFANRYRGPGRSEDFAEALGVSPDGSKLFVTGASDGESTGLDYATVAYTTG